MTAAAAGPQCNHRPARPRGPVPSTAFPQVETTAAEQRIQEMGFATGRTLSRHWLVLPVIVFSFFYPDTGCRINACRYLFSACGATDCARILLRKICIDSPAWALFFDVSRPATAIQAEGTIRPAFYRRRCSSPAFSPVGDTGHCNPKLRKYRCCSHLLRKQD